MTITTILFDLDGTLLPMDLDVFVKQYLHCLARTFTAYGYEAESFVSVILKGIEAMATHCTDQSNEKVFWNCFESVYGKKEEDYVHFEQFYQQEFQTLRSCCGVDPKAAQTVQILKEAGYRLILATNPVFPKIATESRIRWSGLKPEDFSFCTTYSNARRCKPNPEYYEDIMTQFHLNPQECLMVGNDMRDDMIAQKIGMQVFLLTPCLINRHHEDISVYPHGDFDDLLTWLRQEKA